LFGNRCGCSKGKSGKGKDDGKGYSMPATSGGSDAGDAAPDAAEPPAPIVDPSASLPRKINVVNASTLAR
jgi:hypothetical protein